jgi:hypothetical protein
MKMSDFFNLPMDVGSSLNNVGTACTELADCDFYLADFRRENTHEEAHLMARAAAHAINQHDALVELNKELVELIGEMNEGYSATIRADELIKRAKELNHER